MSDMARIQAKEHVRDGVTFRLWFEEGDPMDEEGNPMGGYYDDDDSVEVDYFDKVLAVEASIGRLSVVVREADCIDYCEGEEMLVAEKTGMLDRARQQLEEEAERRAKEAADMLQRLRATRSGR